MSELKQTFTVGEDVRAGDRVSLDNATGTLSRHDGNALCCSKEVLPTSVRVLGFDFSVTLAFPHEDEALEDLFGYCSHKDRRIVLDKRWPEHYAETLLHEVMHAISNATNSELDEPTVHRLTRAIYAVLRDNPGFSAFVSGGTS